MQTLEGNLPQIGEALDILEDTASPTGLLEPSSGEPLTDLASIRMRVTDYIEVTSFCGSVGRPKPEPRVERVNAQQRLPISDLAERHGSTSLFGMTGWLLKQSVQKTFVSQGWTDEDGLARYRTNGEVKVMDSALMTGFSTMALLLEGLAQGVCSPNAFLQAATKSVSALPTPFAKISGPQNRKLEILYGVRRESSYQRSDAVFELGANEAEEYEVIPDKDNERGKLSNWEGATKHAAGTGKHCGALHTPIFAKVWNHLARSMVALPELFPQKV